MCNCTGQHSSVLPNISVDGLPHILAKLEKNVSGRFKARGAQLAVAKLPTGEQIYCFVRSEGDESSFVTSYGGVEIAGKMSFDKVARQVSVEFASFEGGK